MAQTYEYYYAIIGNTANGRCTGVRDSSNYVLDPTYVPIDTYNEEYLMKYYWPLPEAPVESFDDFQGQWYTDAAHTVIFDPNA